MIFIKNYLNIKIKNMGRVMQRMFSSYYTICSSPLCNYLVFNQSFRKVSKPLILVGFVKNIQKYNSTFRKKLCKFSKSISLFYLILRTLFTKFSPIICRIKPSITFTTNLRSI